MEVSNAVNVSSKCTKASDIGICVEIGSFFSKSAQCNLGVDVQKQQKRKHLQLLGFVVSLVLCSMSLIYSWDLVIGSADLNSSKYIYMLVALVSNALAGTVMCACIASAVYTAWRSGETMHIGRLILDFSETICLISILVNGSLLITILGMSLTSYIFRDNIVPA